MGLHQHGPSQRRPSPVIFVGVLALLVLAVGGWWALWPDNETDTTTIGADGEPQSMDDDGTAEPSVGTELTYLVLDPAPAGYRPHIISTREPGVSTVDLWGRAGAEDPFVEGDLAVLHFSVGGESPTLDEFGDDPTIEIAGRTVQPLGEGDQGQGVAWLDDDQATAVVVMSLQFDQHTVIEMATELLTTGQIDTQGLDLLAEDATWPPRLGPASGGPGQVMYIYGNELDNTPRPEGRPDAYSIAAFDPSDGSEVATAWLELLSGGQSLPESKSEPVTAGDFTGELVIYTYGPDDESPWLELRFQLPDGTGAVISAERVTVEELAALAVTARRATAEEVQKMEDEFRARAAEVERTPPPTQTTTMPAPLDATEMSLAPGQTTFPTTTITLPTTTLTTGLPETSAPSSTAEPQTTTGPTSTTAG
ncbi:MAG: hypothetical protein GY773_33110 [Actinomycetia bacterium]|nr:hypothetical protein [Actinomycetes bacterium]